MKKVLVTGGAGYIGSTLVGLLLNKNYRVTVIDNLSFGGESLLGYWHHPNFEFFKLDITDSKSIHSLFETHSFDAVVHLAAIVGDPACSKQPILAKIVNYEASINLIEISMKHKVERFIFASTCSNYGKMLETEGYVDEYSPLAPVSLYAELKVKIENLILDNLTKSDEFCPTVLRIATVYGLSPRMRFDLTVNEFTKEVVLDRELEVFGEQFWRPYCHVYDVSRAILLVLESSKEKVAYNVFNVGETTENYQKKMIVEEIKKFIPNAKVKYIHKEEDPRNYRVSFEKIKKELGFFITKKVPDGISEIIEVVKKGIIKNPDDRKYYNS